MKDFNIPKAIFLAVTLAFAISTYNIYFPSKKEHTTHLPKKKTKNIRKDNTTQRPVAFDFNQSKQAKENNQNSLIKTLRSRDKSEKSFITALETRDKELISEYIDQINPSYIYKSDLMTPLMLLIEQDFNQLAIRALKKVRKKDINHQNKYGATALVLSSSGANTAVTKALIERGANPNIEFNKRNFTLLMDSSFEGNVEITKLLIQAGAEINTQDKDGKSALIYAAREGHTKVVELLLISGANKDLKDKNAHSALDYAFKNNFNDIVKNLK